jgi:acyl-CoA synthetase (AMP-forming)/AMP-acid ligase II
MNSADPSIFLSELLHPALQASPDRVAVQTADKAWSYGELDETAAELARRCLKAGLQMGDRIAFLLPNRIETLLSYLACFKAGLIAVPLDYNYRPPQINYVLRHSGSRLLVAHAERQAELSEVEAVRGMSVAIVGGPAADNGTKFEDLIGSVSGQGAELPSEFRSDDVAVVFYTSGTTSRPKGVTLTRAALAASTTKILSRVPLRSDDLALVAAPMTRPFAVRTQVFPTLHAGGMVAFVERFTAENYLRALRQAPPRTFLALAPSALHQVVHYAGVNSADFAQLRLCISGGDRVPRELHDDFRKLTGLDLTEQCGMTETGVYAVNPPFGRKQCGSIGFPMYGVQLCLVDARGQDVRAGEVGEIMVKSPMTMDGYWNDTAETRKAMRDGWISTGDLGRFDENGFLWFVSRKKDIIVHDGANVAPAEVEDALLGHPGVCEACVVGVDNPVHGQNVHAFVTLRGGIRPPAPAELLSFAEARLSRPMVPEQVHVLAELPRTGSGKIDRDRLHWQAEAGGVEV